MITLLSLFVTGFLSASLLVLKPLIVGALIDDYQFTPSQAGFVAGIEMVGIGLASFCMAITASAKNRKKAIYLGAMLGILGSLGPLLTSAYMPVLVSRFIAGVGCGMVAPIVLAILGTTRNPDRTFGQYYLTSYLASAAMMAVGTWAVAAFHVKGAYGLMSLALIAIFLTARNIPYAIEDVSEDAKVEQKSSFPMKEGLLTLGLSFVYWIGMGALWSFVERLGMQASLTLSEIGAALSLGQLTSIAGALMTSLLHIRYRRLPVLAVAISLAVASVILLGWSGSLIGFMIGVCTFSFIWPVFLAYLGGIMATLDRGGRIVALSVTSQTLGMAVGSAVGGTMSDQFGYVAVPVSATFCFILCLVLLGIIAQAMRHQARCSSLAAHRHPI